MDYMVLILAGNEPDSSSNNGMSCSTFEKKGIKKWIKINKTKIHWQYFKGKWDETVQADKVKTQNSTEQTEYPQRPKLRLLSRFKIVKSMKLVHC